MKDWLSIGEFSKQTGFSNKALRVYEEKGLLSPHARSESQYRYYHKEQILLAKSIQHYKDLGFSLDEIKTLLAVANDDKTLIQVLKKRLAEARDILGTAQSQIYTLESILTSLNTGQSLTTQQRREVMENVFETSLENIKRRGIFPREKDVTLLANEIEFMSDDLKIILPDIKNLIQFAQKNDFILGPGRGSTAASMILFGEGYAPFYPDKYGLLPEFFSRSTSIWFDVEYSRYQELGAMCDAIKQKSSIDVAAFRSPVLDIFRNVQNQVGAVDFDKFSDSDPMILEAPQRLGLRGLWDFDWSPNFEAFRSMTPEKQKEYSVDTVFFEKWISENKMKNAEDFMNISYLYFFQGNQGLVDYQNAESAETPWLELRNSRGILIYREDWIRIFARHSGLSIAESYQVHRALARNKGDEIADKIHLVKDLDTKNLLIKKAEKVFMKSHMVTSWWHFKRTAIMKSLWQNQYLQAIDHWEQQHGIIWQEFGYKKEDGSLFLKA